MSLLTIDRVTRRFGDLVAVNDISLSLESGEVVGLVGANGAGKTTLIRMILGLLSPTSGSIDILGKPPGKGDKSRIGYVPQGLGLYTDLTVSENLAFAAAAYAVPPIEVGPELKCVADRQVRHISLGLQRRLAFAAVLSHDPEILILDEPTSGVGPVGRVGLWDQIRSEADSGSGVLVSTHYMEEAEECDRVLMISSGEVVASGTIESIIGERTTPYMRGADPDAVVESGLIAIYDGKGWRVPGLSPAQLRSRFGPVEIENHQMDFEEAFIGLAQ